MKLNQRTRRVGGFILFRSAVLLVIVTIAALSHAGLPMISTGIARAQANGSPVIYPATESNVGISFRTLTADGNGGLWVGGSVFGIQGLLLKTGPRMTRAQRAREVEFIRDLSFTDRRNGWMVADLILYHTRDAGRSWQRIRPLEHLGEIETVCFIDDRIGWIAGRNGLVFRTVDAGLTWRKQDSGIDFTIEKIRFLTRDKGWAMGRDISSPSTRVILLLTSDSGMTWKKAPESDTQQFRSVMFANPQLGWAINSNGDILQTLDGGATWKVRRPRDGRRWVSIFFANESEGWAAGNGIIHTTDGGKTWNYQLKPSASAEQSLEEIMFADQRFGAAIGLERVLTTRNGGDKWEPISDSWKPATISRVRREKFKSVSSRSLKALCNE
jgi:photosystem II stability/assembly factor-like uncharacterized protein